MTYVRKLVLVRRRPGVQYAYLGNWGKQFLYWVTLFGLGIWALRDLFRLQKMLDTYNAPILEELDRLDRGA